MSANLPKRTRMAASARRQRGLSLIEMMVAVLIALFLIAGVVVVEQGVNMSYNQQNGLAQLQDEQRFAMSVLTSVIGTAGYFPNPTLNSITSALPAAANFAGGQSIYAPNTAGAAPRDAIYVRYQTAAGDGVNLCDGSAAGNNVYTSFLYVAADPNGNGKDLFCQLETGAAWGAAIPLVTGVTDMQVLYGISTSVDNNVTEYLFAQDVTAGGFWPDVTSVKVMLTFTNPLANQPGQQATVTFTRVISVMGRVGASQ